MKFGLIGENLSHSFSKEIHNQLFDYPYELKELPKEELDGFMRDREFSAINVTIPYKEAVIPYLDVVDNRARMIGAVNTIVNRDGKLYGYNTDFDGLYDLFARNDISLKGKKVLILGSGGTSKTALAVAQYGGACALRVSRTVRDGCITYEQAKEWHTDAQVVINTTPCGMYPNLWDSPLKLDDYPQLEAVVDVIYNPLRTKLVLDARKRGIPAVGGLFMLIAQAVSAAERFLGATVTQERVDALYRRMQAQENIVLVGMPASGKSTVGKRLAKRLNRRFIDTDALIAERTQKLIPELFAEVGESGFRDLESEVIREISRNKDCVIATGGGAVLRADNVDWLRQNGRIYFIDRSLELLTATDDRPLALTVEDLQKRYAERYDLYCTVCDRRITADSSVDEVENRIREDFLYEHFGD